MRAAASRVRKVPLLTDEYSSFEARKSAAQEPPAWFWITSATLILESWSQYGYPMSDTVRAFFSVGAAACAASAAASPLLLNLIVITTPGNRTTVDSKSTFYRSQIIAILDGKFHHVYRL